mmetsp:Transcript_20632/g.30534  ORF Transcript_20632/g.30534 Transcript_20632/m.30534 type:complete len:203 (+) Transcript_20632:335-943(+)
MCHLTPIVRKHLLAGPKSPHRSLYNQKCAETCQPSALPRTKANLPLCPSRSPLLCATGSLNAAPKDWARAFQYSLQNLSFQKALPNGNSRSLSGKQLFFSSPPFRFLSQGLFRTESCHPTKLLFPSMSLASPSTVCRSFQGLSAKLPGLFSSFQSQCSSFYQRDLSSEKLYPANPIFDGVQPLYSAYLPATCHGPLLNVSLC